MYKVLWHQKMILLQTIQSQKVLFCDLTLEQNIKNIADVTNYSISESIILSINPITKIFPKFLIY
jgi:hypothetical protein